MSLHPDIQKLAAQGRNGDSMLLHVTPEEVQGLHRIAQMNGTQMTINPATGLPEANFMKDFLPVLVGAGAVLLAPETGGMSLAMGMGAAGAFGTSMAVGNSFNKSLMMGLMGGAGGALGGGLGALGAGAVEGGVAGAEGATMGALESAGVNSARAAAAGGERAITPGVLEAAGLNAAEPLSLGTKVAMGPGAVGETAANAEQIAAQNTQKILDQAAKPESITPEMQRTIAQAGKTQTFGGTAPLTAEQNYARMNPIDQLSARGEGISNLMNTPGALGKFAGNNKLALAGLGAGAIGSMASNQQKIQPTAAHGDYYSYPDFTQGYDPTGGASGQQFYNYNYGTPTLTPYAEGGSVAGDIMYPQSQIPTGAVGQYGNRSAIPIPTEVVGPQDAAVDPFTGEEQSSNGTQQVVRPMAAGGIASLGGYSDGGNLTQGPGDGVSDSIPASIGGKQPARLADGEFVIPARAVAEVGNGSTKAGAKKFYAMLKRIEKSSKGRSNIAANTRADRFMPA